MIAEVGGTQTPSSDKKSFLQKTKHVMAYIMYFLSPQSFLIVALALIGLAIKLRSKGIAGFMIVCQFFQQFAGKSDFYRSIYDWMEPHKYFKNFKIHYETPLEKEKVLLPFHPHSIYSLAIHFAMYQSKEALSKAYYCASRMALQIPFVGYFYRWQGLVGADPSHFKQMMKEGKLIAFVPGGFEEASLTSDRFYTLYIEHKGFIKYAMQTGYKIRPVFVFNENKAFPTIDRFYNFRLWLNKMKMPGTLFFWKKLPLFPDSDLCIEVVVAKGFEILQRENPTEEEISLEHQRYYNYVNEVYNKFKSIYDPTGLPLRTFHNGKFTERPLIPPPTTPRL